MANTHQTHNPNCDGAHCLYPVGEVRKYPLGGGANMILCECCWAHENLYRRDRAKEPGQNRADWPRMSWDSGEVYDND